MCVSRSQPLGRYTPRVGELDNESRRCLADFSVAIGSDFRMADWLSFRLLEQSSPAAHRRTAQGISSSGVKRRSELHKIADGKTADSNRREDGYKPLVSLQR
jgi:hypothetical protein